MPFITDLTDLLEADIADALSLESGQVYRSREAPQKVPRKDVEVIIIPRVAQDPGRGTGHATKVHEIELRIRLARLSEGAQTGATLQAVVRGHGETLVDRYAGARPFQSGGSPLTALVGLQAEESGDPFLEPGAEVAEARVTLKAMER